MSLDISLYQIESDLSSLIEMREDSIGLLTEAQQSKYSAEEIADRELDISRIDIAIREYMTAEIRKVDSIRSYWLHCKLMAEAKRAEAAVQIEGARVWESRLERLKSTCQQVMEMIPFPTGKPKKLEGRTGALYLKGNGGRQAVTISDESLVPPEYLNVTITCTLADWISSGIWHAANLPRVPSLSLIAAALERPCSMCRGTGEGDEYGISPGGTSLCHACRDCGGSGKAGVPGARLEPRGSHVEVK